MSQRPLQLMSNRKTTSPRCRALPQRSPGCRARVTIPMPPAKACHAPAFRARATTPLAQPREWVALHLEALAQERPVRALATVAASRVVFPSNSVVAAVVAPAALRDQVAHQEVPERVVPVEVVPVEAVVAADPVVEPQAHSVRAVRAARQGSRSARSVKNLKCKRHRSLVV